MPVTVTYDLTGVPDNQGNDRSVIRSMFERLHWRRVGGSVLRYDGVPQPDGSRYEDWLNHVAPALMFMQSYLIRRNLRLKYFTIDADGTSFLDHSDPAALLGTAPISGAGLALAVPTNEQCAEPTVREFITASSNFHPAPPVPPDAVAQVAGQA